MGAFLFLIFIILLAIILAIKPWEESETTDAVTTFVTANGIYEYSMRILETRRGKVAWSWKVTVENITDQVRKYYIKFFLEDAEKYALEGSDWYTLILQPGEVGTITKKESTSERIFDQAAQYGINYTSEELPRDVRRNFTTKQKREIFNKYGGKCAICGKPFSGYDDPDIEYHHIEPWAEGGLTVVENGMLLCKKCHKKIHSKESIND